MTQTAAPTFTPDELATVILADEPDTADAPLGAETWMTTVGQLIETQKGDWRLAGALRAVLDGSSPTTITGSGGTGIIRFTRPARFAKCSCGKVVPTELVRKQGMFYDLGPDSDHAKATCVCGLDRECHPLDPANPREAWRIESCGGTFKAMGARPMDSFYCGCSD